MSKCLQHGVVSVLPRNSTQKKNGKKNPIKIPTTGPKLKQNGSHPQAWDIPPCFGKSIFAFRGFSSGIQLRLRLDQDLRGKEHSVDLPRQKKTVSSDGLHHGTVDGVEIRLTKLMVHWKFLCHHCWMVQKSGKTHQLRLVVYPILFYRGFYIYIQTVGWPWDFWTINSIMETMQFHGGRAPKKRSIGCDVTEIASLTLG